MGSPKKTLFLCFLALAAFVLAAAHLVPLPTRLTTPASPVLRYRDGTPFYVFLSPDEKARIAPRPGDVAPKYVEALLRLEDKRFRWHPGFDPIALGRAFAKNVLRGRRVSGGSTITMQLARILEPRPRTLRSKVIEIARAVQLTLRLSKTEVLDAYLTFLPFGRNLEGVEAAAYAYFGHGAAALTALEIATLLAVPQDPNDRYPAPKNAARLAFARDRIAGRLGLAVVRDTPPPLRLRPFPHQAPHAAFWLKARGAADSPTSLDGGVQKLVENLVRAVERATKNQGVKDVGVVVVEHETGLVRGLVGGFDFFATESGAQYPAFAVPRSPGSALKPFLYAAAIDRGIALPEQLVEDVPRSYGGYGPKNYDGRYAGLVDLERALSQSLNVPFVTLLERLGIERFVGMLVSAGATRLAAMPGKLGLSSAVGGLEMNALELAGLYAALARDGAYRPLAFAEPAGAGAGPSPEVFAPDLPLFAPGAAWLTRRALRLRDRPDFPRRRDFARLPRNVFWKTGTSFGHRDAWAIGAGHRYTAAVWFGNVDHAASFALVGADLAAPLLFDVLEGLETPEDRLVLDFRPDDLAEVSVCAYSGHIPGPGCRHAVPAMALRSAVPTTVCPFHVELAVDVRTGLATGPSCVEAKGVPFVTERRRFMVWPTSVKRYLSEVHRLLPEPPALHPACLATQGDAKARLAISSPRAGHAVILIPGLSPDRQEIPLEAETDSLAQSLSWFVDGAFLGRFPPSERVFWTPTPGEHEIAVADGLGLVASRRLEVRSRP